MRHPWLAAWTDDNSDGNRWRLDVNVRERLIDVVAPPVAQLRCIVNHTTRIECRDSGLCHRPHVGRVGPPFGPPAIFAGVLDDQGAKETRLPIGAGEKTNLDLTPRLEVVFSKLQVRLSH